MTRRLAAAFVLVLLAANFAHAQSPLGIGAAATAGASEGVTLECRGTAGSNGLWVEADPGAPDTLIENFPCNAACEPRVQVPSERHSRK